MARFLLTLPVIFWLSMVACLAASPASTASYEVPVVFEANLGQAPANVRFIARARSYTLAITSQETIFRFSGKTESELRMRLLGANPDAQIASLEELPGRTSYFRGSDR